MLELCRLCEHIKTSCRLCVGVEIKLGLGGFFNGFAHTAHTIHNTQQNTNTRSVNPQPNNSVEWCVDPDAMRSDVRRSSGRMDGRFGPDATDVYYFKCVAEYYVRTH